METLGIAHLKGLNKIKNLIHKLFRTLYACMRARMHVCMYE